ncbi:dTDP-4-dehydro-6-deoxyglucose aminotransferase [Micromonospora sp. KC207]|uniref:dTDP-4-dehydro-6-deoxyglucose aminotransferase n=1 Tax=Micromonospora sp. KC207 TaxID=2530377 RepID=UPI00104FD272|nr:dTDP-4-dehydro-6-deoxyglucose aminotransferase [Micromonospora sp. KC207]TDC61644.1 dTDP-4-dehydro-6-deoxyglucose aminotransferase [Micromonospora sp. KC207]
MKRNLGDLAIFGGHSSFLQQIHVGRPNRIDRTRLFDRLSWALDNEWLTNNGPLAREFEERVADMVGVRNCVATCNATAALQLLAHATELTGQVIMPSLTFAATAHAVRWLGLEPVFCDIDPRTGCVDHEAVVAAITPRTSAIIGVHLWGRPCDVDALEKVAADAGLRLFFDAAHAIGCTSQGRPVGQFGDAEVFSFHATKVVNAFEGGAVVTDDDDLAHRVRSLANFGIGLRSPSAAGGTNAKMSEACAAMGLTSLDAFPEVARHNRENYEQYCGELARMPGLSVIDFVPDERQNYQYVIVEIDPDVTGLHRDLLVDLLRAENVVAQRYFSPACHELEPYRSRQQVQLPHTERLSARVLALPTGSGISREDIRRVCNIVRLAVSRGSELTARWQQQSGPDEQSVVSPG